MTNELRAGYGFIERQMNLCRRFWKWEAVFLVYALVNAVSIGYIVPGMVMMQGMAMPSKAEIDHMVMYLLIGSLMWGFLSVVFDEVSNTITWERWEGTIEYTFMAPVGRFTHLIGICLYSIVYSLLRTALVLILVSAFFNIDMSSADYLSGAAVLIASSFAFVGLGIVASVLPLISPEKGSHVARIIQALLLMISGIYYPVDVLPEWIQWLSRFSPATYALDGIRKALLEGCGLAQVAESLICLMLSAIVLIPFGLAVFSIAEEYARRTGLLKRNG
ncbi:MAG: ABC transporter [Candidatus Wallbacteria bacterium HGW-Wallbacteria-1]|uniref:Transport permease protein n=1 Tax=Candidatus Wallbacteria bacterium HGW-Wallbacteria-1 TaxID=2013854 RepID=A0A2N1PNY0_9BACT|nr:MAG: ABC transporter [Candidatus Wallbacteria bacterium HGW-Wallbacteria-1]